MVTGGLSDENNLKNSVVARINEAEVFSRKFGSFTKTDYEVLMFTAYLDSLKRPARDYEISIELGITESRVRTLRIKSQLLYPRDLKWVDELSKSIEHGYYDKMTGQITVTFEDPSVQSLMKNKIEENFGTVGQSINVKHLILPVESFLILAAHAEKDNSSIIQKINDVLQARGTKKIVIEKEKLRTKYLEGIPDMVSFLSGLLSIYSTGRPIIEALIQKIT